MFQQIRIVGNVGGEPITGSTGGRPFVKFSVAVNKRVTSPEGGKRDEVTWFSVIAWGALVDAVGQIQKGDQVMVVGRVRAGAYRDATGAARASIDVTALEIMLLGLAAGAHTDAPDASA